MGRRQFMPDWMQEFWNEWSRVRGHWQELGRFFKVPAIRFFVSWFALVPVIANALSELPERVDIQLPSGAYSLTVTLPFSWQILWVSSMFYAFAFLLYIARCPTFIKTNPDFSAFSKKGHSNRWLAWELYYGWQGIDDQEKLADRLISKGYATAIEGETGVTKNAPPRVEQRGTVWEFSHNGNTYEVCLSEEETEQRVGDIFWEIFGRWAGSREVSRNIVWFSLLGSILLFAFVVAQNIWAGFTFFAGG